MQTAKWIGCNRPIEQQDVLVYKKTFTLSKKIRRAELAMSACGVYCAVLNGTRVSFPLAPGYDCYIDRMQLQRYDVTNILGDTNELRVSVGRGWYGWFDWEKDRKTYSDERALIGELTVLYEDGSEEVFGTDESWNCCRSALLAADIYDGERVDARIEDHEERAACVLESCTQPLIEQDSDFVLEHETLRPKMIVTPKGERVLDFGQNMTGYVRFEAEAHAGDKIFLSHGEELDKYGNFYNENYRSAKSKVEYICKEGKQCYQPTLTFFGFRYVRLDECPTSIDEKNFSAIVIHTKLDRRGSISSSNPLLNQLFSNILWGQRGNFVDIPTDCPQRDERLGWLGDAQVFCSTANYNFDCERFYKRFLRMINIEQDRLGIVNIFVPDSRNYHEQLAEGYADAITIMNRDMYDFYGDKEFLREEFPYMKKHVDSIGEQTSVKYMWCTDKNNHFGDWLGLDAASGSYIGASRLDYIATAYYAYSTQIVIDAGKELGEDVRAYEELLAHIKKAFKEHYAEATTQTEYALAIMFDLTDDKQKAGDELAAMIEACGGHLQTGFIGTPYLLYALTQTGHSELAYKLLLREEYPSWLYSVLQGATTIWEHMDGKNDKGDFWSADMNSFNHYAYGCVGGWIYSVAGGITPLEKGYKKVRVAPIPSGQLDWLDVRYKTKYGEVVSKWYHRDGKVCYEITLPVDGEVVIDGVVHTLTKGTYTF